MLLNVGPEGIEVHVSRVAAEQVDRHEDLADQNVDAPAHKTGTDSRRTRSRIPGWSDPGVGALYTSSRYGDRFLAGWVEGPARGYVSRGLGVSSLPVRINCPAELTVFDLMPAA